MKRTRHLRATEAKLAADILFFLALILAAHMKQLALRHVGQPPSDALATVSYISIGLVSLYAALFVFHIIKEDRKVTMGSPREPTILSLGDECLQGPPKFFLFLLYFFVPRRQREPLLGDLIEEYDEITVKFSRRHANVWFIKQVLTSIWPFLRGWVWRLGILGELLRRLHL